MKINLYKKIIYKNKKHLTSSEKYAIIYCKCMTKVLLSKEIDGLLWFTNSN